MARELLAIDDSPTTPSLDPPVTTISQPTYDTGRTAANLLLEKIAGRHRDSVKIKLQATSIDRKSCGVHVPREAGAFAAA